jgi:hypothetical protein
MRRTQWFLLLCLVVRAALAHAQVAPAAINGEPDPFPPIHGINLTVVDTTQHSSVTGWSYFLEPTLSYRFNKNAAVNATVPYYFAVKNFVPVTSGGTTTYPLMSGSDLLGDASVAANFDFEPGDFGESFTATGAFPTGNNEFGLSANAFTYNFTNHLEYSIGIFTPDIELGEGNSSSLVQQTVRKSYTAVGQAANFQAGSSIDFTSRVSFDLEAFELMPIGNQNIYGTVTRKHKKGKNSTKQVLEGTGVAEDNGFTADVTIPLPRGLELSGDYQRSLIQGYDIVSVSISWVLRRPKRSRPWE